MVWLGPPITISRQSELPSICPVPNDESSCDLLLRMRRAEDPWEVSTTDSSGQHSFWFPTASSRWAPFSSNELDTACSLVESLALLRKVDDDDGGGLVCSYCCRRSRGASPLYRALCMKSYYRGVVPAPVPGLCIITDLDLLLVVLLASSHYYTSKSTSSFTCVVLATSTYPTIVLSVRADMLSQFRAHPLFRIFRRLDPSRKQYACATL